MLDPKVYNALKEKFFKPLDEKYGIDNVINNNMYIMDRHTDDEESWTDEEIARVFIDEELEGEDPERFFIHDLKMMHTPEQNQQAEEAEANDEEWWYDFNRDFHESGLYFREFIDNMQWQYTFEYSVDYNFDPFKLLVDGPLTLEDYALSHLENIHNETGIVSIDGMFYNHYIGDNAEMNTVLTDEYMVRLDEIWDNGFELHKDDYEPSFYEEDGTPVYDAGTLWDSRTRWNPLLIFENKSHWIHDNIITQPWQGSPFSFKNWKLIRAMEQPKPEATYYKSPELNHFILRTCDEWYNATYYCKIPDTNPDFEWKNYA